MKPAHRSHPRCVLRPIDAAIAATLLFTSAPAFALDSYVGPNTAGSWSTAANWSPAAVPVNGDDVQLGNFSVSRGGVFVDVTLNTSYSGAGLNSLLLDSINCNTITLNQNSAVNMVAATETIGKTIANNVYNQGAGTNTVTNNMSIALNPGSTGNYNLSGGTLTIGSNASLNVGVSGGVGTFTESGTGSLVFTNSTLNVAATGSAIGIFNLNGGSISGAGTESIGGAGQATFNQTAGTHNLSNGTLFLGSGFTANANGTYNLSGTAASTFTANSEVFGSSNNNTGSGNFFQSGGVHTIGALGLHIESGSYSLTGGTFTGPSGYIDLGEVANKPANFTQNGGTFSVSTVFLGDNANATGNYTLLSGLFSPDNLQIGDTNGGAGNFTQSGGTAVVNAFFSLGVNATTTGAYNLSGTAAVTLAAPRKTIGFGGTGVFTQSGGTNTVTSTATSQVDLGNEPGAIGEYLLAGGSLKSVQTVVGDSATGIVVQTAGLHQLQQFSGANGNLILGNTNTGNGTYQLVDQAANNPTLTAFSEIVGAAGTGNFFQQGGTNSIAGDLTIASSATSNGSYQLLTGSLASITLNIGSNGNGTFTQSGGNTSVSSTLTVANSPGAVGTLNLSANATLTAFAEQIGDQGTATVNHSGGSNTLTAPGAHLTIGNVGTGAYNLSGTGVLTVLNATNSLLNSPKGTFHQTGGTFNGSFTNQGNLTFDAGTFNGSIDNRNVGTLNVNGTLASPSVTNNGTINISVNGALLPPGGGSLFSFSLINLLGGSVGGNGAFANYGTLAGFGTITGLGGFTNNGLLLQGAGPLTFAMNLNNNADIQFAAGRSVSLNAANFTNAGSIEIGGASITGNAITNNPGATITGPGLILNAIANSGTINPGNGTLSILTAWNNAGLILLLNNASTLTGATITNSSTIQGTGTIGAPIANAGTIEAIGGTLNIANSITNPSGSTLIASTGNKLLLSSGLATNAGLISLTGGTVDNNNHPLNNTGEITGYGTLRSGGLTNNGTFTLTGGVTTINGNVTNAAAKSIEVKFTPAIFTGSVTNNGTVKTTSTTVTFAGGFTNNGNYISDPSVNIFNNITNAGLMTGGTGDVFTISPAGNLNNSGTFTNGGTLNANGNITNSGSFTQSGPQSWSPGATFTNTAGTATFQSNAKLYGLTITAGTVDITNSKFVINPTDKLTTLAALQQNLATHSLISSTLPTNFALALLDNAAIHFTTFGGNPVDSNSLLLSEELLGDANLDGTIDLSDLSTILNHFGATTPNWTDGNFDHAAQIDLTDLSAVLNNFGATNTSAFSLQPSYFPTPEPTSLLLLLPSTLLLKIRRPRQK